VKKVLQLLSAWIKNMHNQSRDLSPFKWTFFFSHVLCCIAMQQNWGRQRILFCVVCEASLIMYTMQERALNKFWTLWLYTNCDFGSEDGLVWRDFSNATLYCLL